MEEYVKASDFEEGKPFSFKEKVEKFLGSVYWNISIIILAAIIFFALGRLSKVEGSREPVRILGNNSTQTAAVIDSSTDLAADTSGGQVVASKSGTKYHYPWCAGAKQIAVKNLITFNSVEEARAAGYTPASNCKGLK